MGDPWRGQEAVEPKSCGLEAFRSAGDWPAGSQQKAQSTTTTTECGGDPVPQRYHQLLPIANAASFIEERILRNMSYQTALNFAPAVPVRRNKPTPKSGRGSAKSKSDKSPSSIAAAPSSPEHVQYDDGDNNNHLKKSSANNGKGPSQLDALDYSDSDGEGAGAASAAIRRGAELKERRRAAAAKLRRQKEAGNRSSGSFLEDTDDEEDGGDRVAKKSKETSQRKRLGGGGNNKKKKKRRVIDDSDDDECDNDNMDDFIVDDEDDSSINGEDVDGDNLEEEEIIEPNRGREKAHSKSAEDNEGSDDDHDEQPMSHAALAFQMQLNQQAAQQEEDLLAEVMMANRSLSEDEAFRIWLEDLALQAEAHLHKSTVHVSTLRQQKAASQIERPLCTRRESTLGSSAWRPDFRDELKHRPLYRSFELHQLAVPDDVRHCGACGRSSHSITHRIEFSGPRYSADRTWQSSRDLKHADWEACLGGRMTTNHGDKGSDDEDIEPKIFYVGGHCRARTELYHSLLHFKFLVFDEILGQLGDHSNVAVRMQLKANGQVLDRFLSKKKRGKGDAGESESDAHRPMSAEELMSNGGFVERQYERCRNLTEESEEKWGGHKGEMIKVGGRSGAPKRRKGQATVVSMLGAGSGANGASAGRKHQSTLTFSPK